MRLIKAEEARPGQRAARDVTDLRGNLLFKAGTQLDPALLAAARERNVSHLFIEDDGAAGPAVPAADLDLRKEAAVRDIDRMFAGADRSPLMASLREASKRYLMAKLGR
jgi:hypothetical protein